MKLTRRGKITTRVLITTLIFAVLVSNIALAVSYSDLETAIRALDKTAVEGYIWTDESSNCTATIETTLHLDEASAPLYKPNMQDMLGVQYETNGGYEYIIDSNSNLKTKYTTAANKLFDQPIVRWGGSSSNEYNMMNVIVPKAERTNSPLLSDIGYETLNPDADFTSVPTRNLSYGPVEFIKAQLANNPNVRFLFCLSITRAYPEDNANFIHFLLDDKDESEWGALRASYGLDDPINLYGIELGNEMYYKSITSTEDAEAGVNWYINTFKKHAEAINAISPEIDCIPCVNGKSTRGDAFYIWDRAVIKELGVKYKHMAIHEYYTPGYASVAYNFDIFTGLCVEQLGANHGIKMVLTEHARYGSDIYIGRADLESGLQTGYFLNAIYQRDDIDMATYHCGISSARYNKWYFMTQNGDGTLVFSSLPYLYKIYSENIGDRVLRTSMTTDSVPAGNTLDVENIINVLATPRGKNELVLFISNTTDSANFNVNFDFKNKYTLKKEIVMTAPNLLSLEYSSDSRNIFSVTETEKNIVDASCYAMPAKSFVCLILQTDGEINYSAGSDMEEDNISEPIYIDDEVIASADFTGCDGFSLSPAYGDTNLRIGNTDLYFNNPGGYKGTNVPVAIGNGGLIFTTGRGCNLTSNLSGHWTIDYKPGGLTKLNDEYRVETEFRNVNSNTAFGFRFNIDDTANSYYMFTCGYPGDSSSPNMWYLYKVINKKASVLATSKTVAIASAGGYIKGCKVTITNNSAGSIGLIVKYNTDGIFNEKTCTVETTTVIDSNSPLAKGGFSFVKSTKSAASKTELRKISITNLISEGTLTYKCSNNKLKVYYDSTNATIDEFKVFLAKYDKQNGRMINSVIGTSSDGINAAEMEYDSEYLYKYFIWNSTSLEPVIDVKTLN